MPVENYGSISDGEDDANHSGYAFLTGSSDFTSDDENTHEDEDDLDEAAIKYYSHETDAEGESKPLSYDFLTRSDYTLDGQNDPGEVDLGHHAAPPQASDRRGMIGS